MLHYRECNCLGLYEVFIYQNMFHEKKKSCSLTAFEVISVELYAVWILRQLMGPLLGVVSSLQPDEFRPRM